MFGYVGIKMGKANNFESGCIRSLSIRNLPYVKLLIKSLLSSNYEPSLVQCSTKSAQLMSLDYR
jgi:hypothetical protein